MIATARLSNLGPVESAALTLTPKGTTLLVGPSGAGKSTALQAIVAPWTGRMPQLTDGADKGGVELTTGGGVTIRMGLTPTGASWSVQAKGAEKPTRYPSWTAMTEDPAAAMLPARRPELAEAIALPFGWAPLLTAECGRPLRDLLMSLLPPVDLAERIAEAVKAAGFVLDESDLEADTGGKHPMPVPADHPDYPAALVDTLARKQRDANADAKAAKATAAEAKRNREALVEAPDPGPQTAHDAAKTTIATARAWDTFDAAKATYTRERAAYEAERAALATWTAARAKLGKARPEVDPSASMVARKAVDDARAEVRRLEQEAREAELRAALERGRAEEASRRAAEPAASPSPASAPVVAAGGESGPSLTYSDEYRRGFRDGVVSCVEWVVEYRETCEFPDLRTVRDSLSSITLETPR